MCLCVCEQFAHTECDSIGSKGADCTLAHNGAEAAVALALALALEVEVEVELEVAAVA